MKPADRELIAAQFLLLYCPVRFLGRKRSDTAFRRLPSMDMPVIPRRSTDFAMFQPMSLSAKLKGQSNGPSRVMRSSGAPADQSHPAFRQRENSFVISRAILIGCVVRVMFAVQTPPTRKLPFVSTPATLATSEQPPTAKPATRSLHRGSPIPFQLSQSEHPASPTSSIRGASFRPSEQRSPQHLLHPPMTYHTARFHDLCFRKT